MAERGMSMRLSDVGRGRRVTVVKVADPRLRPQAARLGIQAGVLLLVKAVVPQGPVIVQTGPVTVAVGRRLAARIEVHPWTRKPV